jgi:hypothetical protein
VIKEEKRYTAEELIQLEEAISDLSSEEIKEMLLELKEKQRRAIQ